MNNARQELDSLLEKRMDRLTFIKHIGLGFGAIIGVTGVIKAMNSLNSSSSVSHLKTQTFGYGSSSYGGGSLKNINR